MDLFIDLETIPAQGLTKDALMLRLKDETKPPASIKKQESIDAWYATEQESVIQDKWLKSSLDGALGEIAVIGWAVDDGNVNVMYRNGGETEANLLTAFFDALKEQVGHMIPRKIGHNILGFDLRFLYQRAVVNGIKPSTMLHHDSRYNGEYVFDTMLAWAGWGKYIKLAELCAATGVECSKDGMDGSKVWPMIESGRIEEVANYCAGDVEDVRRIYRRMQFLDIAEQFPF